MDNPLAGQYSMPITRGSGTLRKPGAQLASGLNIRSVRANPLMVTQIGSFHKGNAALRRAPVDVRRAFSLERPLGWCNPLMVAQIGSFHKGLAPPNVRDAQGV
jgi:hypothetical protein